MSETKTVELTEEDYLNVIKWWTSTSMMVEAGIRTRFSDSEHKTIAKLERIRETFQHSA